MADPSTERSDLARRIVEHEAAGSGPPGSAAALEAACRRLKNDLIDLLGSGGVSAMLRRALHLSQREQPLLAGVAANGEDAACFTGLAEALAASTDEEATVAAAAVLTHVFDLLVMLLGEELGMKPVRKLWPQANRGRETDE